MSSEDSYSPPANVKEEASRALKWISEGKAGDGFTDVGRARARDLSSGRSVSLDTIKRMHSYFSRHEVDKKGTGWAPGENGYPSPGRVAWAAWGGNAGRVWVNGILSNVSETKHASMHDKKGVNLVVEPEFAEDLTLSDLDGFLEHYGVKGMHWGVRKSGKGGRSSVDVRKLSDNELKVLVARMQLEKQARELQSATQTKSGKKYAASILQGAGKTAASVAVSAIVGAVVKRALDQKFDKIDVEKKKLQEATKALLG